MEPRSILDMNRGGFKERVDYEMQKIIDNILDPNTAPTAKRKLTITLEFVPDSERTNIVTNFGTKLSLAATNPSRTILYVSGADFTGNVQVAEMTPQIPGQTALDGTTQEAPAILKIVNFEKEMQVC